MIRLLFYAALASLVCKLISGRWPWEYLRSRPTRSQALYNARRLLGVESGAGRNEINAAHRRMIAMIHPDRGGSNAQVHEVNAARDLLLEDLPHES
jgi:hypothetical protein